MECNLFIKQQIKPVNQVNLIEFAKSQVYELEKSGHLAQIPSKVAVFNYLKTAIVFLLLQ